MWTWRNEGVWGERGNTGYSGSSEPGGRKQLPSVRLLFIYLFDFEKHHEQLKGDFVLRLSTTKETDIDCGLNSSVAQMRLMELLVKTEQERL